MSGDSGGGGGEGVRWTLLLLKVGGRWNVVERDGSSRARWFDVGRGICPLVTLHCWATRTASSRFLLSLFKVREMVHSLTMRPKSSRRSRCMSSKDAVGC